MQNSPDVVRSWRTCPSWTRTIKEAKERVAEIREKLKSAQSRQKSYADKKRQEISFNPESSSTLRFHLFGELEDFRYKESSPLGTLDRTVDAP